MMITILGYEFTEQIYQGLRTIVYRGQRKSDGLPIVAKIHRADHPSPGEVAKFRRDYEIGTTFDSEGIIKYYGYERYQNDFAVIAEDFGGIALNEVIPAEGMDIEKFLRIAIQSTAALGVVHQKGTIHKDIKPRNLLIQPETLLTKLIDFGIASQLSREDPQIQNPNILEGTLEYISPEQTGRMNRSVDYRTDFYSLGCTFYQMLCGRLPFEAADVIQWVHSHIAKQPVSPHEQNPSIPTTVSEIVMKLLSKTAESRYQSAYGLLADLRLCLTGWESTKTIENVNLGSEDVSSRFSIPQKLYGREQEIDRLLAAFDRISGAGRELMLVAGYSGIGKSALVGELYKPITEKQGFFISGKFDQFQRNIPFASIIEAFRALMRQLLTGSEAEITAWREKLQAALGPNGQVVIDIIPEVEMIIGKQQPVVELGPTEAQNRFNFVFLNFIHVFAQPEHPLVIFLDDLQWADVPTLNLLQLLITDPDTRHLLVIVAFRDNEVNPLHPLILTLAEIEKTDTFFSRITLAGLTLPDVTQLLADTLHTSADNVAPLAELVCHKTDGNPFFVNQFLTTLYEAGGFTFVSKSGSWQWDIDQIEKQEITDNVVELMAAKLRKSNPETQHVLQLAACIGGRFELEMLAVVYEKSPHETANALWPAMQEGLIQPQGDAYKLIAVEANAVESVSYRFLHDRVQQAAYSLISEAERKAVHLKIGRLLLKNTAENELEERIFDIVNPLNLGVEHIVDQKERYELAHLNLIAGMKAKASAAYQPAYSYLKFGVGLLAEESWQTQYDLALPLYVQAAEAAYLNTDFEQMEQLAEVVVAQAKTLLDKVKVYEVKIQACITQDKPLDAIKTAREILERLGIKFPKKPNKWHILLALLHTKFTLVGKRIEDLANLPEMTDPIQLATLRILSKIGSAAYIAVPELMPLTIFRMLNLSVKNGNAAVSVFGYATYGLILCGVVGDIGKGYRFGKLALNLLERLNAKEHKARTFLVVNAFVRHWKEHVRETLPPMLEAYQSGLDTGDMEYVASSINLYLVHSYVSGVELAVVERERAKYDDVIGQLKHELILHFHRIWWQKVLNLMGRAENPCRLIGEIYNEEQMLPVHLEANNRIAICTVYFNKLILCYLFDQYAEAVENAAMTESYLEGGSPGMIMVSLFHFYDSLAQLAVYPSARKPEQKRILKKVAANQKKMKKWAHHAPMNHRHKYNLVEAERARVRGQDIEAMEYYDRAISGARQNEYIQEEALANELAAKFYLAKGKEKIAQTYMLEARYAYEKWGATAKVRALDQTYPQLLSGASQRAVSSVDSAMTHTIPTTETQSFQLDLSTVMKASQTISGEIVLSKLLEQMMGILIENAGAQKGCLILEKQGQLLVEAEAQVDSDATRVLQSIPVIGNPAFSEGIINYVARTRENVVLNDASHEGQFTRDPYIVSNRPKSVLCAPLIHQGKLSGIVYLENNLTTSTFTPDRLQVMKMLCSQIAISLENAQLYAQLEAYNQTLEDRVKERTQELQDALHQLKETQNQLIIKGKMAALGKLVAGVAHEFNNPIAAVKSATDVSARVIHRLFALIETGDLNVSRTENRQFQRLRKLLTDCHQTIMTSAERVAKTVESLKRFSRLDEAKFQKADLHEGLDSALTLIHHELQNRITVVKDYGQIPEIYCSPDRLNQVFMNLLLNAVEAIDNEGSIHIQTRTDERYVYVKIKDDGKGIPQEHMERIFDPGYTTKGVGVGLGLGLSTSFQILKDHDGEIQVESQPGEGSTFTLILPKDLGKKCQ
ncbi:MAG: AAA family ATPase [Candidatus Poribacteria bacterium]|nr:AAA family ATPase [Candidatus Poribacteria bacterium]